MKWKKTNDYLEGKVAGVKQMIYPEQFWDTTRRSSGLMWEWPIHFSEKDYSKKDAIQFLDELIKVRENVPNYNRFSQNPDEIDERTRTYLKRLKGNK